MFNTPGGHVSSLLFDVVCSALYRVEQTQSGIRVNIVARDSIHVSNHNELELPTSNNYGNTKETCNLRNSIISHLSEVLGKVLILFCLAICIFPFFPPFILMVE